MVMVSDTTLRLRERAEVDDACLTESAARGIAHLALLWEHRRTLAKALFVSLLLGATLAFLIPKQYESTARIMPPEQQGMGTAMLAALAGKAMPGVLSSLAGNMFGMKDSGSLFVQLLQSGAVQGNIVDRFNLQKVYRKKYHQDAVKRLAHQTEITEDRKSGIIKIVVADTSRERARDMAQAYVEGLDDLLIRVNTSAARREREFIERRLVTVQNDLERAQVALSDYASKNATLDIKEQTRAMVDAGAKLQAQLIVARSEVDSLGQIYGDGNVRMRAANARVGELERELKKMTGSSTGVPGDPPETDRLYPPLRELPILAVRWADLYREVKIKETVYDLLTEQYELARIDEVKSIPSVRVIDAPSWPEKKSFPPRLIIILVFTLLSVFTAAMWIVLADRWRRLSTRDPRKQLVGGVWITLKADAGRLRSQVYGHKQSLRE